MSKLHDLWVKYWTDKAYHNYLDFYDAILSDHKVLDMLEIGVYWWASIRMWREYFPFAKIIWVDINSPLEIEWCTILQADATTLEFFDSMDKFDLIIDDGWHLVSQQKKSFLYLWHTLRPWGIYIVEDICTSFRPAYCDEEVTAYEYIKQFSDTNCTKKYSEFRKDPENKWMAGTLVLYKNK